MFCIDFICLPHILQGKNYHVRVFLCHPGPLSSVILVRVFLHLVILGLDTSSLVIPWLDHGIQVIQKYRTLSRVRT